LLQPITVGPFNDGMPFIKADMEQRRIIQDVAQALATEGLSLVEKLDKRPEQHAGLLSLFTKRNEAMHSEALSAMSEPEDAGLGDRATTLRRKQATERSVAVSAAVAEAMLARQHNEPKEIVP
jgi:hypothetical protein